MFVETCIIKILLHYGSQEFLDVIIEEAATLIGAPRWSLNLVRHRLNIQFNCIVGVIILLLRCRQ